ncbi:MAG: DinB family protein [Thermoflexales bacterium]
MLPSSYFVDRLSSNLRVFDHFLRGIKIEQAAWRPAPEAWTMLEVVCHLYDEEREDFRTRLRLILEDPAQDWPPIHPGEWVISRGYSSRDFPAMVDSFIAERAASIVWLRSLRSPALDTARKHGEFALRAGDLLGAWLAHDFLHLRQINELHYAYTAKAAEPYSVIYAGDW